METNFLNRFINIQPDQQNLRLHQVFLNKQIPRTNKTL